MRGARVNISYGDPKATPVARPVHGIRVSIPTKPGPRMENMKTDGALPTQCPGFCPNEGNAIQQNVPSKPELVWPPPGANRHPATVADVRNPPG